MKRETGTLRSTDGIHTLKWFGHIPDDPYTAMLIIHGMAEYKERYDKTAADLANDGIACYCYDQLGHGETRLDESENGFFGEKDGVKYIIDDVHNMMELVKERHPGKKVILLGHSMGSFIVRYYAAEYKDPDILVVSGTSGKNPGCAPGILLTKISAKLHGPKYKDKFIDDIAMGGNSKRFKNEELPEQAWLSHDMDIRRDMKEKSFMFTVSGMKDMFTMLDAVSKPEWYERIPKNMPIYLFSGSEDPIGNYGKGFSEVAEKLKAAGAKVTAKLYDGGRHEMLNETNRDEVIADLIAYVRANL